MRSLRFILDKIVNRATIARFEIAFLVSITIGFIAFMTLWNVFVQPRLERRAYEAGQAEAERRAAAAGGWDKWIEREIAETTNKEKEK